MAGWLAGAMDAIPHSTYAEGFCGSAAVLLSKEPASREFGNDGWNVIPTAFELFSTAEGLASVSLALRREFPVIHRQLWLEAKAKINDEALAPEVRVASLLFVTWTSIMNIGSFNLFRAFPDLAERIMQRLTPALQERVANVSWTNRGIDKFLGYFKDHGKETLIYLDPPYVGTTPLLAEQRKGVTIFGEDDLAAMLVRLGEAKYHWVMSCFPHPLIAEAVEAFGWVRTDSEQRSPAKALGYTTTDNIKENWRADDGDKTEQVISNFHLTLPSQGSFI